MKFGSAFGINAFSAKLYVLQIVLCRLLFAAVFFFSLQSGFAQLNPAFLQQYTEQNGVPASQVTGVLPDRFGYVWLGTINGLSRYDGYEFKRFFSNPNDSTSIGGLVIWALFEDKKGRIWVSSGPGNLNRYDPVTRKFKHYKFEKLVDHPANIEVGIVAIEEDANGRIYLGITTQYGTPVKNCVLYVDEKDDTIKKLSKTGGEPFQNVAALDHDTNGNVWVLSYSGCFRIGKAGEINQVLAPFSRLIPNEYPTDLDLDQQGHLWMITNRARLFDVNLADSNVIIHQQGLLPGNNPGNNLSIDADARIWMGTNMGVCRFNTLTGTFENFPGGGANPLDKVSVLDIAIDSFGTAWIGTADKGLFKYQEKALFRSYTNNAAEKNVLTRGWASIIYRLANNTIFIGTSVQGVVGINLLNPATGEVKSGVMRGLPNTVHSINGVYEEAPGELLVSTDRGLYRLLIASWKMISYSGQDLPRDVAINRFVNDSRGNSWLCTTSGLYKREKGSAAFKRYDLSVLADSDASSNEITLALESKRGGLWLSTNNGLFFYNYQTDKIERHGLSKNSGDVFITQDINSIFESNDTTLWVGGWQGGLSRYNAATKKISIFTRNDGLPSMSIQAIQPDQHNNALWLSTFDGLSYFDLTTSQFVNFTISDGIQGQLFADGASLKTPDGIFVFGGSNGVTVFRTDDIIRKTAPPKVFISDFKLFNKSVFPGENTVLKKPVYDTREITLAHNQNNIGLEFTALHYADPAKNRYLYKLENFDEEWREVGSQHVAFYPNLPPGNYRFIVKASNNYGIWNEEGARLNIIVRQPWWFTVWAYLGYLLLLIAGVFFFNRYMQNRLLSKERDRTRARELEQAKEIEKAYHTLEQTYQTLKATQSQLIQSEKMASLGELTAGIAHEIQNPLNFVNNFSEVNKELLLEMKSAIQHGNLDEVKLLADDIITNEEKINYHGKRADGIVKGMLQHSRSSNGEKEATDINILAEEYLRLAYHGLRAKDKEFNATLKTDFDPGVGIIKIVPQDVGRVLLNLITNAFYAVGERKKRGEPGYEPEVSVSTKKSGNIVEITVKDNGNGIPASIKEKIFQPFFTTKPTGQGTGLGLSLSYDIIKAHDGEISVNSKEGVGSAFVIVLKAEV